MEPFLEISISISIIIIINQSKMFVFSGRDLLGAVAILALLENVACTPVSNKTVEGVSLINVYLYSSPDSYFSKLCESGEAVSRPLCDRSFERTKFPEQNLNLN